MKTCLIVRDCKQDIQRQNCFSYKRGRYQGPAFCPRAVMCHGYRDPKNELLVYSCPYFEIRGE